MASKRCRCWTPSLKPPRITETSFCTEEDLTIFRRLHEKYNCSTFSIHQLFGHPEWKGNSSVSGVKTAQHQPAHEIQIKHEPLTPVSLSASQGQRKYPVSSRNPGLASSRDEDGPSNCQYLPAGLAAAEMASEKSTKAPTFGRKEQTHLFNMPSPTSPISKQYKYQSGNGEKDDLAANAGESSLEGCCTHTKVRPLSMRSPLQCGRPGQTTVTYAKGRPWDSDGEFYQPDGQGTVSCVSSWSRKENLWQGFQMSKESTSTMAHNQNCVSIYTERMTHDNTNSEYARVEKPSSWDRKTFDSVKKTCKLPLDTNQQKTSSCTHCFDFRSTNEESDSKTVTPNVTAYNMMQNSRFSNPDLMRKYLLMESNPCHSKESSHLSLYGPNLATPVGLTKSDSRKRQPIQTSACVTREAEISAGCASSGSRVSGESRSHTSVKNKASKEKIHKKLTAYPGTIKKKKTANVPDGVSTNMIEVEEKDPLHGLNKRRPQTAASSVHGSKDGETPCGPLQNVRDVRSLKEEQRGQLVALLEKCSLVGCLVLYKDGTTNTDSSLFTRPKVEGLIIHCEDNSYLLPVPQKSDAITTHWSRRVLEMLLKKEDTVRVAINCKQFVISLLRDFSLGGNREAVGWQFEDPAVAGWLLSPDNPPHTLQDLCKFVQVSFTQTPPGPHNDLKQSVRVMKCLRGRLKEADLWPLFLHVEMALSPLLAAMELQPIRVNVHTFLAFSNVLKKKLEKVEKKAYEVAGHAFCISSTHQLRQLLYEELRLDQQLPGQRKVALTASTQRKSTSEAMLKQLVHLHPLPAVVLEYRHLLKLKSTYIDGMLEAVDSSVLHTHWDQMSAATGRLVSSHPNIQAIPKTPTTITDYEDSFIVGAEQKSYEIYAREPFIAGEGNVLLAADFQQIELRLLAHLANDPALKGMFQSSQTSADIFIQLTAQWLSKAYEDVTHAEREQTKRIVYSILYGVGKERLAEYLKVSPSRAKDIMDSFLVSFPAIQVFTKKCVDYAQKHGYTETVMGRRRWLEGVHHRAAPVRAQAERQAVNFCVQGSAADLCKRAMVKVEETLRNRSHLPARLLMHIHDELVWELPQNQLPEMCELVKSVMEDDRLLCQPLLPCLSVPITVSLSSGVSWAHLSPWSP